MLGDSEIEALKEGMATRPVLHHKDHRAYFNTQIRKTNSRRVRQEKEVNAGEVEESRRIKMKSRKGKLKTSIPDLRRDKQ
jgi:hypothetical protein